MTNCESCNRELKDGEHCYGPQEYEGQVSPKWVLCLKCARESNNELFSPSSENYK